MDKWKPQSAADLVGNGANLQLMRQWLANWHRIHLLGGEAQSGPGARGAKMDMAKKALLISGAPGTGKTSASQILGRCARAQFFCNPLKARILRLAGRLGELERCSVLCDRAWGTAGRRGSTW